MRVTSSRLLSWAAKIRAVDAEMLIAERAMLRGHSGVGDAHINFARCDIRDVSDEMIDTALKLVDAENEDTAEERGEGQ